MAGLAYDKAAGGQPSFYFTSVACTLLFAGSLVYLTLCGGGETALEGLRCAGG
jgi:hypothetical protein